MAEPRDYIGSRWVTDPRSAAEWIEEQPLTERIKLRDHFKALSAMAPELNTNSMSHMLSYGKRALAIGEIADDDEKALSWEAMLHEIDDEVASFDSADDLDREALVSLVGMWVKLYTTFGDDATEAVNFLQAYGRTGIFPLLESDQGFADGSRRLRALEWANG